MARVVNGARLTMPGRGTGGFTVDWYGADGLQETLDSIASDLMAFDDNGDYLPAKRAANSEMRQAAKNIANRLLIPQMRRTARSAPVPIARAMAETARAKTDRLVAVQVGGVSPPLSGFKRGIGAKRAKGRTGGGMSSKGVQRDASSRTFRTTLAWGSEFGPKGGRRLPGNPGWKAPRGEVNHYKAPRNERGYWVLPAVENVMVRVQDEWDDALDRIFRKYTTRG